MSENETKPTNALESLRHAYEHARDQRLSHEKDEEKCRTGPHEDDLYVHVQQGEAYEEMERYLEDLLGKVEETIVRTPTLCFDTVYSPSPCHTFGLASFSGVPEGTKVVSIGIDVLEDAIKQARAVFPGSDLYFVPGNTFPAKSQDFKRNRRDISAILPTSQVRHPKGELSALGIVIAPCESTISLLPYTVKIESLESKVKDLESAIEDIKAAPAEKAEEDAVPHGGVSG